MLERVRVGVALSGCGAWRLRAGARGVAKQGV